MTGLCVVDVRLEHYSSGRNLGLHEAQPRVSWRFINAPANFQQEEYEIKLMQHNGGTASEVLVARNVSAESHLVPWPLADTVIGSREVWSIHVRAKGTGHDSWTPWSEACFVEAGLLSRQDWTCHRISAPWATGTTQGPLPEDLFRKEFALSSHITRARLYVTTQGVYEAEINGARVGDYFLAPGCTVYSHRLQYQTYDVTDHVQTGANCLGVRVAEGWCTGRFGFGNRRAIWADRTALLAQLEIDYADGTRQRIVTDESWEVLQGPTRFAELYDGEVYDARAEVCGWSSPGLPDTTASWSSVVALPFLPPQVALVPGYGEHVRHVQRVSPKEKITTPSGKIVLDFGQNLVGVVEIRGIKGQAGDSITVTHAEVLEHGELGLEPLRACKARDVYTLRGAGDGETYRPRFTFHGFRYVQIDGWPVGSEDVLEALEALVVHTDMEQAGTFSCSNQEVNQLFSNVRWSMRGNFLSIPTDCPQRDERLGWTGDAALFTPTATRMYKCFGLLKNWLQDVRTDQSSRGGVPPLVCPNILQGFKVWGDVWPAAIWHDVIVLTPWALWIESGDAVILEENYDAMLAWLKAIPRNSRRVAGGVLWDPDTVQLGDWLDPAAPNDEPQKAVTDSILVADAFLIHSLDLVSQTARILGRQEDAKRLELEAQAARTQFSAEYISLNGRLVSDSQTAYALAICFNLLSDAQTRRAGDRLVEIVRLAQFKIATGFAGTPFICEALVQSGHANVAFAMLLNRQCPSWLYPVSMGATTIWERWDSMLPDGTINGSGMTSFNHYALGAIAHLLVGRVAGLSPAEPGWRSSIARPVVGGGFRWAKTEQSTPYGTASCSWELLDNTAEGKQTLKVDVQVPPTTRMEVVLPGAEQEKPIVVCGGTSSFSVDYQDTGNWPVQAISYPF
ncbi:unnamed protein product [Clonostachys chloroleuca]|uniref:alpha-L-rhamnosidase n=1 Tax=Clonostachys chloroleuca TaxID=1926264 RepID=A0AA35M2V1_9HYPO|nr:unnamed protein product [Clonostachys chloroleuca]